MRSSFAMSLAIMSVALLSACVPPEPEAPDVSAIAHEGGPITEAGYVAIVTATHQCMVEKGDPDPGLMCVAEYTGRIFGTYQ